MIRCKVLSLTAAVILLLPLAPMQAQTSEGERLHALFRESDENNLKRNPILAIFRGDLRYADRLGNSCTDAYFAAEKAAAREELAALKKIDRSRLNDTDKIAYDVFQWRQQRALDGFADDILALTIVRRVSVSRRGGAPRLSCPPVTALERLWLRHRHQLDVSLNRSTRSAN